MDTQDIVRKIKNIDKRKSKTDFLFDLLSPVVTDVSFVGHKIHVTLSDGDVVISNSIEGILSKDNVLELIKDNTPDVLSIVKENIPELPKILNKDEVVTLIKQNIPKLELPKIDSKEFIEVAKVINQSVDKKTAELEKRINKKIQPQKNTQTIRTELEKLYLADGLDAKYIKNLPKQKDGEGKIRHSSTKYLAQLKDVDLSGLSIVDGKYVLGSGSGGGGTWGSITGTLSDQTDLQTALDSKASDSEVVKKAYYTQAHSLLVQQSGTGTPESLQVANETIIGRKAGGASEIEDLSAADVRSIINVEDGAEVNNWTESGGNVYRSSGGVGVGTSVITKTLNVEGETQFYSPTGTGMSMISNTGSAAYFTNNLAGDNWIAFADGRNYWRAVGHVFADPLGTEVARIQSSTGNVGIGTASPQANLTLNSNYILGWQYTASNSYIGQSISGGGLNPLLFKWDPASDPSYQAFSFEGSGSNKLLTILNGGNVGIGTTSPTDKLHVNGTTRTTDLKVDSLTTNYLPKAGAGGLLGNSQIFDNGTNVGIGTSTPSDRLQIENASSFVGFRIRSGGGFATDWIIYGSRSFDKGILGFWDSNSGAYRLVIQEGGNVGIGTTTPTEKLHVEGNARITGAIKDSTNSVGTSGQMLSSTVTGTEWVDAPSGGGGATFKAGQTQRAGSSIGTQVIAHGLGTTPKRFKLTCFKRNGNVGFAHSEGVKTEDNVYYISKTSFTAGSFDSNIGNRLAWVNDGASRGKLYASSVSWDDTNVTITWSKLGIPSSASINMLWEASA